MLGRRDTGGRRRPAAAAEQRRALLLASLHGRTAKEISEIEGIPLGTAKTRIRTALLPTVRRASFVPELEG